MKAAAINFKNRSETDRWDDKWYAFSVTRNMCLMIGWYNLDTSKSGWAAAQNQPSSWSVRSNSKSWQTLGNDAQRKYSYTINGQTVDLDLDSQTNLLAKAASANMSLGQG